MAKDTTNAGPVAPNVEELAPYLAAPTWQLIPLHNYATVQEVKGKSRKRGKSPIHGNWTDFEKRRYSSFRPKKHMEKGDNLGVRLKSDQLVLDVDPRGFPQAEDLTTDNPFRRLCADVGLNPDLYPRVETGGGGLHIYTTKPADAETRGSLKEYPGVEFKTRGQQVVAAGSVHPDTFRLYAWDDFFPSLADGVPPAPAALLEMLSKPKTPPSYEGTEPGQLDAEGLAALLEKLDPEDFGHNDVWFELMCACHHGTAGDGRQEFIEWSTRDPRFADHEHEIGYRWDSLDLKPKAEGRSLITVATLQKALKDAGHGQAQPGQDVMDLFDEPVDEEDLLQDALDGTAKAVGQKRKKNSAPRIYEGPFDVDPRSGRAANSYANALRAVSASGLSLAWNLLDGDQVFLDQRLPWKDDIGRSVTDTTVLQVRTYLMQGFQSTGFEPSKEHVQDALNFHAARNIMNPVLDYLDGLEWDGEPRVSELFTRGFRCVENEYTGAVSTCFMVGAVARQREPGCKFDTMPVVRGDQGTGKSTGFKVLFSPAWFSDAAIPKLTDKDAPMNLRGVWMHEFAELASLRKADMDELKAFMSRSTDRYRPPYGRKPEIHPRRVVFGGSVNSGGYLSDPTGARRFWPLRQVPGERVDLDWIAANRDQLWAEADALHRAGESTVLPERLWAFAAEEQRAETTEDPWADEVRDLLADRSAEPEAFEAGRGDYAREVIRGELAEPILDEPPEADRIHTKELLARLVGKADRQHPGHPARVRKVMEALGWTYRKSVRVQGRVAAGYIREP